MKNIINCLLLCGILSACHLLETKDERITAREVYTPGTGSAKIERDLRFEEVKSGNNNNLNATKLSYKGKTLVLNKEARCQRICYGATERDIMDIIAKNKVISNKTNSIAEKNECPIDTYEGIGAINQKLQISIAYCESNKLATVISIINPGAEVSCDCD